MADKCPDCGRPIVESFQEFEAQWETHVEVCYPHANFGGSELCAERTVELLRTKLRASEAECERLRREVEEDRAFITAMTFAVSWAPARRAAVEYLKKERKDG